LLIIVTSISVAPLVVLAALVAVPGALQALLRPFSAVLRFMIQPYLNRL